MASGWKSVLSRVVSTVVREATRTSSTPRRAPDPGPPPAHRSQLPPAGAPRQNPGAGDFTGRAELSYSPRDDGRPDPGEIVWAWVPFEEGDGRGKDRPVLVAGRDGTDLVGFMLTSKDHDRDAADEARHGRVWVDIGTGAWDRQGRPSEVRVDRVLRVDPADVRREGAVLDRRRFDQVAAEARRVLGW
ncbi:PemK-like, MazF-like toxin of type II toxin-antitoxin system [Klenkia soli]|uniref:PemK-like, MazF-like toxin of type II toxin-antitoxin system n=1 Tax=Klenkia soli TaxID=1052260 RepID=A0A1H0N706_9ACTN|nr:type II toxin-antitoxin system PemK/MazF family toxin [Klenkia soli]SDO88463.1 PemK-like, MazF-like toxin of type II toxin-antitoxin system [Klenkia soli]